MPVMNVLQKASPKALAFFARVSKKREDRKRDQLVTSVFRSRRLTHDFKTTVAEFYCDKNYKAAEWSFSYSKGDDLRRSIRYTPNPDINLWTLLIANEAFRPSMLKQAFSANREHDTSLMALVSILPDKFITQDAITWLVLAECEKKSPINDSIYAFLGRRVLNWDDAVPDSWIVKMVGVVR